MNAWRMFLGLLPLFVFAQPRITSEDLTDEEVALLDAVEAQ